MTTQAALTSMVVTKASNVNGATNVYTFVVTSPLPHYDTDKLVFTFPDDVVGPTSTTCTASTNVLTVTCSIPTSNQIEAIFTFSAGSLAESTAFTFTVSGVTNPHSTEISDTFDNV